MTSCDVLFQHQRKYSKDEYHHRLQTFLSNSRKIKAHNARNHTFQSMWGTWGYGDWRREHLTSGKKLARDTANKSAREGLRAQGILALLSLSMRFKGLYM